MGMNVKKYHVLYLVMSLFTLIAVVMVCFLFMLNRSINVIDQRSREKQATGAGEGEKDGAQLLKIQENGVHVMTPRGVSHLI